MTEKEHSHVDPLPGADDLKGEPIPTKRDVDLGQMLEVDASPDQERKVLWKLDLLYGFWEENE